MWLVTLWALVTSLAIALVVKVYCRVLRFRKYAAQVIQEVHLSMELKEWGVAEQKLLPVLKKRRYRRLCLFDYMRILRGLERFEEVDKLLAEANRLGLHSWHFFREVAYKACRYAAYRESAQAFSLVPRDMFEEQDAAKYALVLVRVGQLESACAVIEPWISPLSHQETYITVGHIYFTSKRYGDAVEFYNRAIALAPCPPDVIYNLAHAYRISGQYNEARKLFCKLLSEANYKEEAIFNIGLCEQKLGRFAQALSIYRSSALWKRGDALLMKYAALAAVEEEAYQLAEYCWQFAFRCPAYAEDKSCMLSYGLSLCHLEKYTEAEKIYLKVVQKFPDCPIACKALAWFSGVGYAKMITVEEGLVYAKRALKVNHTSATLELLSACEARLGNFDTAYEIQTFLSVQDLSLQQKKRRALIMRNLRQRLPLDHQHVAEFALLLAA
ncbi:TPR repeat family protein [Chlamydia ibidis]|uniref:TPR repeat family protein n=2 Tax=Chlamydia ibidis TaxID=1405396 RepID=S7KJC6_9CHLA|nr:tetratricopeptide repeat protein [Chlamydia ibidis]EPP34530.1 TPR repeat family protein [Chlamydia ibidis]EQM62260.1 anaphase-promoting complex, cyclosome, subunit 3 family protein [Chlamydia ibidis 10-1398/6]